MIQQWWSRSSDDIQWWSRSSDDVQWWWSRSDDEDDLKMNMTWRWQGLDDDPNDTEKKTCAENCVERIPSELRGSVDVYVTSECISLLFLIYCNPMFILGCAWVMSCPDVPIRKIYIVNKSCQVIVGNPPIGQGLKSPQFQGTRVIRLS